MSEKMPRTRLKGTENKKPCLACGKVKDRFEDFKPRWAGCVKHRTDRGRRYFQPCCIECEQVVTSNIRQPRCIECDKSRSKKSRPKKQAGAPAPIVAPEVPLITPLAAVIIGGPSVVQPDPQVEVQEPATAAPAVATLCKKAVNKADLFALFSGEVEPTSDPKATERPF